LVLRRKSHSARRVRPRSLNRASRVGCRCDQRSDRQAIKRNGQCGHPRRDRKFRCRPVLRARIRHAGARRARSRGAGDRRSAVFTRLLDPTASVVDAPPTGYFVTDSKKLGADRSARIHRAADYLEANPGATADITGLADKTGSAAPNEAWAKEPPTSVTGGPNDPEARPRSPEHASLGAGGSRRRKDAMASRPCSTGVTVIVSGRERTPVRGTRARRWCTTRGRRCATHGRRVSGRRSLHGGARAARGARG
jgi:hypothetical protein